MPINQSLNDNIDNIQINKKIGGSQEVNAKDVKYSGTLTSATNVKKAIDDLKGITDERAKPWVMVKDLEQGEGSIPIEDIENYNEIKWAPIASGVYSFPSTYMELSILLSTNGARLYVTNPIATNVSRFIYKDGTNLVFSAKGTTNLGGHIYCR